MRSLLVVGGTGVLSYAIVQEALKQGFDVTCINRGLSNNQTLPSKVKIIVADYHNRNLICQQLSNHYFDAIIDVLCYNTKDIDYSVSIFKDKCKQYFFISSCAVYNKGTADFECTEEQELINPLWDYSINKVKCEQKLKKLAEKYNLNYTIIRPAVTYGNTRIPYGIMPQYGYHGTIIHRILNHKPILLWDNGSAYTTIIRVEDFAVGVIGLLGNSAAINNAFNIVGDEKIRWQDIIESLGCVLGVKPEYFSVSKEILAKEIPSKKGEILGGRGINLLISNKKIKSVVPNFKTNISLKDGLKLVVDYHNSHNYIKGIDYSFDADWDRIIKKYGDRSEKIGFIDYLKENNKNNKYNYIVSFYKDKTIMKFYLISLKIIRILLKWLRI